jgi:dienelactone hydrolase
MLKYIPSALVASVLTATLASAGGHLETVQYAVGEKTFEAIVKDPTGDAKGVVYIVHDWDGLNDYEIKRAEMISALGYRAVALDLFGVDAKLEGFEDFRRETGALYQDRQEFRARMQVGIDATALDGAQKQVLLGYCFGGAATLEGARAGFKMDGFVSFHGGLGTPEGQDYSQTNGPILILHGSADPVSNMTDLAGLLNQFNEQGVVHSAEIYGGARHSFTVEGSRDYLQEADEKSWDALVAFLGE